MGGVYITVYSPLKYGSGSNTVGWNLYAHWNEDDLELFNPTPNAYQSGGHHVAKKVTPADTEKKSDSLSGSLAAGSHLAELATGIPMLADVAGPTAWALRVASKVASAFGYSRPPIDAKPTYVVNQAYPYSSTVEGPDVSMPLSLTAQPTLKSEPTLVGKLGDEMSIDAFVGKFGYCETVNLTSGSGVGTVIYNYPLGVGVHTVSETNWPKPFQMLGYCFNLWRGNLRFRIKFVKTKMHTARLMFAFFPGVQAAQTLATAEYVHREIIDIASVEELIYELPFTAQTPYLNTTTGVTYYGSFQILVVNPLQAPNTVANNIDFIVETAMGEGSEWFAPAPLLDLLPVVPNGTLDTAKLKNVPQAAPIGVVKVATLSDAQPTGHQTETAQLCVGEKLLSLRQLIKYPANLATTYIKLVISIDANGDSTIWYYNPATFGAMSGLNSQRTRDFLNLFAPYFRFNRGGIRVRGDFGLQAVASSADANGLAVYASPQIPVSSDAGLFGASTAYTWAAELATRDNQIWKFTLPAWQAVPMVPNQYATSITAPNTSLASRRPNVVFRMRNAPPNIALSVHMARQPADDYELLFFVGPPKFDIPPP